jgi:hypothetical protein
MRVNDPNAEILELVAHYLGDDLLGQVVFVGGAVAGLLITDPAMPTIRPTEDVDLVVNVMVLSEYHQVEEAFRGRGFKPDMSADAPVCRWRIDGLMVDVMPMVENVLGFSNKWYPLAVKSATPFTLLNHVVIQLINAPVFIATKLEAFAGRGNGDFLLSHDLGDVIAIIDGRDALLAECQLHDDALKAYLSTQFSVLLNNQGFVESLSAHLPPDGAGQARLPDLIKKMKVLSTLA